MESIKLVFHWGNNSRCSYTELTVYGVVLHGSNLIFLTQNGSVNNNSVAYIDAMGKEKELHEMLINPQRVLIEDLFESMIDKAADDMLEEGNNKQKEDKLDKLPIGSKIKLEL